MKLIITEKPSVASDIAAAIGNPQKNSGYIQAGDYCITWAFGHLFELDDSAYNGKSWSLDALPLLPDGFNYRIIADKKNQFSIIAGLLKKCESFIIATDAGREGELIAREILICAGANTKIGYRLWTSEPLTSDVVKRELSKVKPLEQFDSLYYSAKARQESDWVVGINLTRLFSLKANSKWTVGRVQTPVLNLIVGIDLSIDSFKPEKYYIIKAFFEKKAIEFEAKVILSSHANEQNEDLKERHTRERADEILSIIKPENTASIKQIRSEQKKQYPPLLYSITTLQQDANKIYGYSAKQTLDIAQILYEKYKCISYPRTGSNYLSDSSRELAKEKLDIFKGSLKVDINRPQKRVFDDTKLTDHHALIPLKSVSISDERENNIFNLIKRAFLAAFMDDYIYESTSVLLNVKEVIFQANGKKQVQIGWKSLFIDQDNEKDLILPQLSEGETISFYNPQIIENYTKPPKRYTDGTIISIMKKLSLGTPATMDSIIEKLISVNYIIREKKNLISTGKGKELIGILGESQVKDPQMTSRWETNLDLIYKQNKGHNGYIAFLNEIKQFTSSQVNKYKTQDFSLSRQSTPKMIELAGKLAKQNNIKEFDKKSVDYNYINSFISSQLEKASEGIKCPCGKGTVKRSPRAWNCSCGKMVWESAFGKKLSEAQALKLLCGDTIEVKGLKSKTSGNKYDAKIKLADEKGRIEFVK